jgi:hypothetical protein
MWYKTDITRITATLAGTAIGQITDRSFAPVKPEVARRRKMQKFVTAISATDDETMGATSLLE